jgi:hypothetical protein
MGTISPDYISQEQLDALCDHIAEGPSVRSFFRDVDTSITRNRFYDWLDEHASKEQQDQYARAMRTREEGIFEDCLEIADETGRDTKVIKRGEHEQEVADHEWISRSRLRVDTRLKMLARMNPKKYGERVNQALSDPDGKALPVGSPVQVYLPINGRDTAGEQT